MVGIVGASCSDVEALAHSLRDALSELDALGARTSTTAAVEITLGDAALRADLVLLCSLPSPDARELALRHTLTERRSGFAVLRGTSGERVERAMAAIAAARRPAPTTALRWKHLCDTCGDPDCERHLFPR